MSMTTISKFWHRAFLRERPSIGLSFFRIAAALTVGFHLLPTFLPLRENYLAGSFRVLNTHLFPREFLVWIQGSPDPLIVTMVAVFCVVWFLFLIGLWSRVNCILMTLGCYYFYALNSFVMGTLAWDILLVTLFLLCLTPYPGDYFSVDALRRRDPDAFRRLRPFFLQRLLQIQIALTYFYTGLYKITGPGNWLTENPVHYVLLAPPSGVTKYFMLRDLFIANPGWCYALGVIIVGIELFMPVLLFWRKTRAGAIYLGFLFHVVLLLTLDVPAIFFFLFPPMLLLFVSPNAIVAWIDRRRALMPASPRKTVVYDGDCSFCSASVEMIRVMDLFARLNFVNYHTAADLSSLHPDLTREKAHSQMHLVDEEGRLTGGFFAFRVMAWTLPMLWPLLPFLYAPGAGWLGPWFYALIARNRYLFHFNKKCSNNACLR